MCGIWAWIRKDSSGDFPKHEDLWDMGVNTLAARGPEGSRWLDLSGSTWCFTRLAINGLNDGGMQPFTWNDKKWAWMCNGEIYNAKELEETIPHYSASGSDCEVLGSLWDSCNGDSVAFARALDGVFALVLYQQLKHANKYVIARDPYGVRPLYYTYSASDGWVFASERKSLEQFVIKSSGIYEFPPGEVWEINQTPTSSTVKKYKYHSVPWVKGVRECADLATELRAAVQKRLMTERPVAALLSGGVDSSLIAALVQSSLKALGKPPLKTFSIGMEGGTDLVYARKVAAWIGSDHHEIVATADEMFNAIPAVVRDIESYDITTVRASVGNWLIARAIREKTDCKVVFNGDGSDEVFGSYLYFYRAPSDFAFERETQRLLEEIHMYDVLRSDRCISSHGLEARTPFLDKQFVAAAMSFPTELRRPSRTSGRMEKQLLRDAFADSGLLPPEVLYRRKEAFSDGVSSQEKSWFEIIQEKIEEQGVVPKDWREKAEAADIWPMPKSKEAFYYRSLYNRMYQNTGKLWPFWMPKWSPETTDPSARTLVQDKN
jgi:asparagine synthase (glutamine-hydrolysing)